MAEPKGVLGATQGESGSATLNAAIGVIQSTYPQIDGQMIVRQVSKTADTTWYRVNWYKQGSFGMYIHHSRFLALKREGNGFVVEDQTVQPKEREASLN